MALNILLITADDLGWDSPGCFGGIVPDVTPNIDRLSTEGMRFTKAHVNVAVCQPSRQILMTGRYPHNYNPCESGGFTPIAYECPTLPEALDEAGYVNGCIGKAEHLEPASKYRFSLSLDMNQMKWGRDPELYHRKTLEFLRIAKRQRKPFFLMANTHDPHRPFHGSPEEEGLSGFKEYFAKPSRVYSADEVRTPGFLSDCPEVREEVAHYYSSVRRCDDSVGAILAALAEEGFDDDTLVMFLSDNGMPMPFAKFSCYLHGTKTPWLVRWPGHLKPGAVEEANFISGIDYAPTVLDILGLPALPRQDGASFRSLLENGCGNSRMPVAGRDSVQTAFYQTVSYKFRPWTAEKQEKLLSEGYTDRPDLLNGFGGLVKDYHMRCLQDDRFGYIYNEWSGGGNLFRSGMDGANHQAMARYEPERLEHYHYRVPEEFYDFCNDPDARTNLISEVSYREKIDELRSRLLEGMRTYGDPLYEKAKSEIGP
jgi:N-sulfoglucosamine sulfohydrolase